MYSSVCCVRDFAEILADWDLSYLRATKWHSVDQAIKRLEDSLKWRREFGLYTMEASHVEPEVRRNDKFHYSNFSYHFQLKLGRYWEDGLVRL